MTESTDNKQEKRPIVSGFILLGIGIVLLLGSRDVIDLEQAWPLFIIVVGLAIVFAALTRDRKASPPSDSGPYPPQ
ncbi:hypothetical protein GF420_02440 [candidate division GN15 bacterium]|jgi:uncharacterized membrane protein AbrB (regulator of aidB expression)|nr:hypothetical protein [candidate division GN15 bacterium]